MSVSYELSKQKFEIFTNFHKFTKKKLFFYCFTRCFTLWWVTNTFLISLRRFQEYIIKFSCENTADTSEQLWTWMLWKRDTRMATGCQNRWLIDEKLKSYIHNWAFIIERPLFFESYSKFTRVPHVPSGFVYKGLQWYLLMIEQYGDQNCKK